MTGYIFPPSKNVVIQKRFRFFIVSIIIKKSRSKNDINYDIKLPL